MRYRKKPVVIEAERIPFPWEIETRLDFEAWLQGNDVINHVKWSGSGVVISTLEGDMFGAPDNYLIIGVKGEVYSCDKEIFRETYEEVEE